MIETDAQFEALVDELKTAPRFALDTESNSMHAYRERICLVQVSVPGRDALVDPLVVDLSPLGPVLADPAITKVMHGADYDILCFKRQHGFAFAGLFDTMIAARVLGWAAYGLGSILAESHGFRANKKMQRFDWGERPLPEHALDYARYDTHFLLELADQQRADLKAIEREDIFEHACLRQTRVEPRPTKAETLGAWRIKGARDLPPEGRGVFMALYQLREAVAQEIDRPVFRVMADALLVSLAKKPPANAQSLAQIRGVHPRLRGKGRARLRAAIEAGLDGESPTPPPIERGMPRDERKRFDELRGWRKAMADKLDMAPDIIIGKEALIVLASAMPENESELKACGALDEWEMERYGSLLLKELRSL
ncbi:MAG: HRDC domain-containing protein [Myxococcota bacterium]